MIGPAVSRFAGVTKNTLVKFNIFFMQQSIAFLIFGFHFTEHLFESLTRSLWGSRRAQTRMGTWHFDFDLEL